MEHNLISQSCIIIKTRDNRKIGSSYKEVVEYEIFIDQDYRRIFKLNVVGKRNDVKCYPISCSLTTIKDEQDQWYQESAGYLIDRKEFDKEMLPLIEARILESKQPYIKNMIEFYYF